jgi:hypothetical protein
MPKLIMVKSIAFHNFTRDALWQLYSINGTASMCLHHTRKQGNVYMQNVNPNASSDNTDAPTTMPNPG